MSRKSKYFTEQEHKCQHCGGSAWRQDFADWLDAIRFEFGKPMIVTSWYRCPDHPIEAKKDSIGAHATGYAVDISVSGVDAIELTAIAYKHGCRRIGWNQKGSARFVHLDRADMIQGSWTY